MKKSDKGFPLAAWNIRETRVHVNVGLPERKFSPFHSFSIDKFFVLNYDVIKIHNKVTQ